MNLKQHMLSLNCLFCGSWSIRESLYCGFCYDSLIAPYVEHRENLSQHPNHIYLIEWHPRHSQFFDQLVYRLKSSNSVTALLFYADLLADLVQSSVKTSDFDALVPIAGSKSSSVHAQLLANRLAKHFGLPVLDVIRKQPSEIAQKYMTAEERRQRNLFSLSEKPYVEFTKKCLLNGARPLKFLIVDDILTTGISFQQSSGVLSGSEQNMIATVFYRPRTDRRFVRR